MSSRRAAHEDAPPAAQSARSAAELALQKKGGEITILDLREFDIGCDFFVIVTAQSEPHVRAIAEWIIEEGARRHGERPWHVEGLRHGQWVLLDYVDWVVHIFRAETRGYYMLERLWGDAPRETIGDDPPASAADAD
ncbi:MAG: ribosome silencing factor [Candidatus Eisenbacteria bacterium]|nr:ribosome silencing factor [Candidatus Eisenbacteria bacterium]